MQLTAFTKWDLNQVIEAVPPTALSATGNTNGAAINTQSLPSGVLNTEYNILGVAFDLKAFGGTSPTWAIVPVVEDSPDGTTWTAVSDPAALPANLLPSAGSPYTASAAGAYTFSIRMKGLNQYVRVQFQATAGGTSPTTTLTALYFLADPAQVY